MTAFLDCKIENTMKDNKSHCKMENGHFENGKTLFLEM